MPPKSIVEINNGSTFTFTKRMVPPTEASRQGFRGKAFEVRLSEQSFRGKAFGLSVQLVYRRPSGWPQPFQASIARKESRVPILASKRGEFE
jgi:hypothetical protein